jgi:hypothetical protein
MSVFETGAQTGNSKLDHHQGSVFQVRRPCAAHLEYVKLANLKKATIWRKAPDGGVQFVVC